MKESYRRISPIFMHGFIGFFVAPVFVSIWLLIFSPYLVNYETGGLILLLSVLCGALIGSFLGLVETLFEKETPEIDPELSWTDDFHDPEF